MYVKCMVFAKNEFQISVQVPKYPVFHCDVSNLGRAPSELSIFGTKYMVFVLEGCSFYYSHIWSDLGISIC